MPTLGPGILQIGAVGSEIDVSCLLNGARIAMSKDEGDSTTKLCGTVRPGKITYTYALSGNVDTDTDSADGLFALSQAQPGSQQPFTYTPNSESETTATGILVIDPLDFGADEYGDDLTSDFEWTLVGAPTYTFPETQPEQVAFKQIVVNGAPTPGVKPEPVAAASSKKVKEPVA